MKGKLLTMLIILIAGTFINAQEDWNHPTKADYPKIKQSGNTVNSFVPRNWKIIGKAFGDLNRDKKSDALLVLRGNFAKFHNKNPKGRLGRGIFDTNPQILVILFKNKSRKGYSLVEQSNNFVIQADFPTMEEPFQEVSIKRNVIKFYFEIFYNAGGWTMYNAIYKYKFKNGKFILIGADKTSVRRNLGEIETRSYNFLTRKVKISNGNISDDKDKVVWKRFNFMKYRTFQNFIPFSWEVEEGITI